VKPSSKNTGCFVLLGIILAFIVVMFFVKNSFSEGYKNYNYSVHKGKELPFDKTLFIEEICDRRDYRNSGCTVLGSIDDCKKICNSSKYDSKCGGFITTNIDKRTGEIGKDKNALCMFTKSNRLSNYDERSGISAFGGIYPVSFVKIRD
jgi:hypothetical protein